MHFDAVFLDTTSKNPYDRATLDKEALGGTEASIVRIAEGLASMGLAVAVIQANCDRFEPTSGEHCFFFHSETFPADSTCDHFIQIRGVGNSHLFPSAKKYVWLHDVTTDVVVPWLDTLRSHGIKIICVSRWHKKNTEEFINGYTNIRYIYNPTPDHLYTPLDKRWDYDRDKISWVASPHKGLDKAVELLQEIRKTCPKMTMLVFNPGYFTNDTIKLQSSPGISYLGPQNAQTMWNIIRKTLCVFMPSPKWVETFGCVAAEANAMGVPIACYRKGGFKESVSNEVQFVEDGDEAGIVNLVDNWAKTGRPTIVGKDEFRHSKVVMEWLKMLGTNT